MPNAPKSKNITWHEGQVSRAKRAEILGHEGAILWFTGLSGSGKSTVARAVELALSKRGALCYVLDGDNVRMGINRDLGFSPKDRTENIRRIGEVAKLIVDSGAIVCTAFISPYRADREAVRAAQANPADFIEVFVDTPIEVCQSRDPKGLYRRALAGEIPNFTGISAPYEAPENAELVLKTGEETLEQTVSQVIEYLTTRGILTE